MLIIMSALFMSPVTSEPEAELETETIGVWKNRVKSPEPYSRLERFNLYNFWIAVHIT